MNADAVAALKVRLAEAKDDHWPIETVVGFDDVEALISESTALRQEVERLKGLLDVRTQSWINTTDALSEANDHKHKLAIEVVRLRNQVVAARALLEMLDKGNNGNSPREYKAHADDIEAAAEALRQALAEGDGNG